MMLSVVIIALLGCINIYVVKAEPVAVFNKGNISLKLDYNDTVTMYFVDLYDRIRIRDFNASSLNITNALSYTTYTFYVFANGRGTAYKVEYQSPRIILARVGDNVSMELKLTSITAFGYKIKNQDNDKTLLDIISGKVRLKKPNHVFSNDDDDVTKFMIQNVGLTDAGHIVATSNREVISTEGIVLVVTDKPTKPIISTNGSIFAGDEAVFLCRAKSTSLPDYYRYLIPLRYKWYLDDVEQPTKTNTYVIKSVSKSYKNKTLTCEAIENGTVSDRSDPEVINPLYGPENVTITPYKSSIKIQEYTSVVGNFSCSADCNPACSFKWNLRKESGEFKQVSSDASLHIGMVNRSWTGKLRCIASVIFPDNSRKKEYQQFLLDVLYPPVITSVSITPSATRRENESAMLICITDSNPTSNVTWSDDKTGAPLRSQTVTSNLTHTIPKLECSHTGNYTCRADNGIPKPDERNIFLNVTCSARLDSDVAFNSEYGAQVNVPLKISFQVTSNPSPQPNISLEPNTGVRVDGPTITMINLYTYNVSAVITVYDAKGFGSLMVRIRGKDQEKTHSITIKAAGFPSKAENLTIVPISYKSVNVTWKPGFDGGALQEFKVYQMQSEGDWILINTVKDFGNASYMTLIVDNLNPRTSYSFKVESCNTYGCHNETVLENVETGDVPTTQNEAVSGNITMLIGTVAAAFLVILGAITIIAVLLWRRKKTQAAYSENEKEVMYAKVDEAAKGHKKTNERDEENAYCNEAAAAMLSDENQRQPEPDNSVNTSRTQNKDGLIYIDVEFSKAPASNGTKPTMVIHGDDERTEYMSVDFTQAPPEPTPEPTPEENLYGNT